MSTDPHFLDRPRRRLLAQPVPPDLMSLRVHWPSPGTAVVRVRGEVDLCTVGHLRDVIRTRLRSTLTMLVIDLSAVTFLAVAGLKVLVEAHLLAGETGTDLYVDPGDSRAAKRLLALMPLAFERSGAAESLTGLTWDVGDRTIPHPSSSA